MKAYPKKTRFAVWGFGVTGRSLAEALAKRGHTVTVIEDRPESDFEDHADLIKKLKKSGVKFRFGNSADIIDLVGGKIDVLAPSPGIHIPFDLIEACDRARVQIAGEIEIAARMLQGKFIAVTGTDGKTTTTSLIHHILSSVGLTSHIAGNIGTPLADLWGQTRTDHWIVVEVSSSQLETVRLFRPHIAVLLNIAEDHLERHGDMRTYVRIKGRIFDRQRPQDHAIVNFDDPNCLQAYGQARSSLDGISLAGPVPHGAWRENGNLMVDTQKGPKKVVAPDEISLQCEHNQLNALASILASSLVGCPIDEIAAALKTFKPLPHRIERIGEIDDVLWVNDSKATNVHSAISAIKCFEQPIVLLLGGHEKNLDLTDMIPYIKSRVRHVVLLGDTRNRFRKILRESGYTNFTVRKTLQEACLVAQGVAEAGDVVLLSPASSSFDQFKDYVERGDTFRKWVEKKLERQD
jgi:UDP-N-acetylmuramoylalanine--D-glutamate ligase